MESLPSSVRARLAGCIADGSMGGAGGCGGPRGGGGGPPGGGAPGGPVVGAGGGGGNGGALGAPGGNPGAGYPSKTCETTFAIVFVVRTRHAHRRAWRHAHHWWHHACKWKIKTVVGGVHKPRGGIPIIGGGPGGIPIPIGGIGEGPMFG